MVHPSEDLFKNYVQSILDYSSMDYMFFTLSTYPWEFFYILYIKSHIFTSTDMCELGFCPLLFLNNWCRICERKRRDCLLPSCLLGLVTEDASLLCYQWLWLLSGLFGRYHVKVSLFKRKHSGWCDIPLFLHSLWNTSWLDLFSWKQLLAQRHCVVSKICWNPPDVSLLFYVA